MDIDPTMSEDTAFATDNSEADTFKFDEAKETTPDSQSNVDEEKSEEEANDENKVDEEPDDTASPVGTESEEQKIPYSRFKKKLDELTETTSKVAFLEGQLEELKQNRLESKPVDVEVPPEWVKLYGDSEVSKDAYIVQLKREEQLQEKAVTQAIDRINKQRQEETERLSENESLLEENLSSLSDNLGKKLSNKQEEAILSIVDEFSPVGKDGKYLSMFPFDKAYEIYQLRLSADGKPTRQARKKVADLTGTTSEGEVDSSSTPHKRGWDNWRDEL